MMILPFQGDQRIGNAMLILFMCLVVICFSCWWNWEDWWPIFKEKLGKCCGYCCRKSKKEEYKQEHEQEFDVV